ncbi:30S ribosomal protein S17 [Candidatus Nardonella dryophthoridicola]|uniref:30S ribosomal protein S17 n=1 Tax=Candidatus Nardonella dryophthoridicola TaxID=1971485 RepID=UPI002277A766|nr:30S ribosomal protein S17 [Candidatus Nardonella dryophthoridicola]
MSDNKLIILRVFSKKMNKSLICIKIFYKKNNIYKKKIKKSIKIIVHDKNDLCNVGDYIYIKKCKNISKKKSWIFVKKKI